MPPAYTFYKLEHMFYLVLAIFFLLAILSVFNTAKQEVIEDVVGEIDPTGAASAALEVKNSIPTPEAALKQESGNFLWRKMNEDPEGFFILAIVVTIILFALGVRLRIVRAFLRGL